MHFPVVNNVNENMVLKKKIMLNGNLKPRISFYKTKRCSGVVYSCKGFIVVNFKDDETMNKALGMFANMAKYINIIDLLVIYKDGLSIVDMKNSCEQLWSSKHNVTTTTMTTTLLNVQFNSINSDLIENENVSIIMLDNGAQINK